VLHFENRASCVGYPDSQENCPTFQRKVHRDVTVVYLYMCISDSSMCIEHIINPVQHGIRLIRRLKIESTSRRLIDFGD
jgi:hypothetical protein